MSPPQDNLDIFFPGKNSPWRGLGGLAWLRCRAGGAAGPRHFFPGKNPDLGAGLAGWRLLCRAGGAARWRVRRRGCEHKCHLCSRSASELKTGTDHYHLPGIEASPAAPPARHRSLGRPPCCPWNRIASTCRIGMLKFSSFFIADHCRACPA